MNLKMTKHLRFLSLIFLSLLFLTSVSIASDFQNIQKHYSIQTNKLLILLVDADAGIIEVSRSKQKDQIEIVAEVNEKQDDLNMGFDNRRNEFSISLDRKKWLKSFNDEEISALKIRLPLDAEIEINSKIKAGKINFDMESLKIRNFELRNFAGEVEVDFPAPNPIEMESLDINIKVGETTLRRLGNARFRDADINSGIGELHIDLSGENLKSSEVNIDLDIGATTVYLPENTGVRLKSSTFGFLSDTNLDSEFRKSGKYYFSNNYDSAAKTLYVSISTGIGELKVKYR